MFGLYPDLFRSSVFGFEIARACGVVADLYGGEERPGPMLRQLRRLFCDLFLDFSGDQSSIKDSAGQVARVTLLPSTFSLPSVKRRIASG